MLSPDSAPYFCQPNILGARKLGRAQLQSLVLWFGFVLLPSTLRHIYKRTLPGRAASAASFVVLAAAPAD
ncbi:hypothetical protein PanWU01x14_056390 [Parasponia andersonii]|uniref:Transmembrane protein n=1 Tax=Parasponia andersonii TaxID=3476 RepID=A0A2P5DKC4_PARAD|nr:hypothetical protein PanWU01x14_056390 [Parasponia andersonii]